MLKGVITMYYKITLFERNPARAEFLCKTTLFILVYPTIFISNHGLYA